MRENKLVSSHYASYLPSIWTDPEDTSFLWQRPQESTFLALSSFLYLWDTHWRWLFYFVARRGVVHERNLDATCTNLRLPATTTRIQFGETWPARSIYGYPMQLGHRCEPLVTSSITIFRSIDFPWRRKRLRLNFVRSVPFACGEKRSTKEPRQKWLDEEGLKPVTFKTVEGKDEFLWEKVSFKFSWRKEEVVERNRVLDFSVDDQTEAVSLVKIWRISSLSFVLLFSRYDEISS